MDTDERSPEPTPSEHATSGTGSAESDVGWDPVLYAQFSAQRSRPFYDLFAQVQGLKPRVAVDLGCGTGELTRLFVKRWRGTRALGIDSSPQMLEIARAYAQPGQLSFELADIREWHTETPIDLLFSNAALHWVAEHPTLIPQLAGMVAPEGTFAVQMPDNYDAPSHQIIREVLGGTRWAHALADVPFERHVRPLSWYVETLMALDFSVNAWRTTYVHVLPGSQAVLDWVSGTTLRPALHALVNEGDRAELLAEIGAGLAAAYPSSSAGTLFPFERLFFVATRKR